MLSTMQAMVAALTPSSVVGWVRVSPNLWIAIAISRDPTRWMASTRKKYRGP